jgi:hypothetical protein
MIRPPSWILTHLPETWDDIALEALALAKALMEANASLKLIAFEVRAPWVNGRFACYVRAATGSGSQADSTAVFEGFDILVPDSWRHF